LPDFPWDSLVPYAATARAHPDGLVDLSVGTPVDPVAPLIQAAMAAKSDSPGYPATYGTAQLRASAAGWLHRRLGVTIEAANVLPVIGAKEAVALLPSLLGLGSGDSVGIPALAYPTYAIGAQLAGATPVVVDDTDGAPVLPMLWVNSPANPTGAVLSVEKLKATVAWCREHGTVLVSDECYLEFGWDAEPRSILHPEVSGGSHIGLLALHSLSKRSNLAGYRAGFLAGDGALIAELLEIRKHAGLIMPTPVQAAMVAALDDDEHVELQRSRYLRRRELLRPALAKNGFRIDNSQGGVYLWASRDEDCWATLGWLADLGILVAPGDFYGSAGSRHVRVALTATDERVEAAANRLGG
jgi:succinyldiaminopimelate transaminase